MQLARHNETNLLTAAHEIRQQPKNGAYRCACCGGKVAWLSMTIETAGSIDRLRKSHFRHVSHTPACEQFVGCKH